MGGQRQRRVLILLLILGGVTYLVFSQLQIFEDFSKFTYQLKLEGSEHKIIAKYWELRRWIVKHIVNGEAVISATVPEFIHFSPETYDLWWSGRSEEGTRIVAQLVWRLQLIIRNYLQPDRKGDTRTIFVGNLTKSFTNKFVYATSEFCDKEFSGNVQQFEPKCKLLTKEPVDWDQVDMIVTYENGLPLSKSQIPKNVPWFKFIGESPSYYALDKAPIVLDKMFPMQSIISWWTGSLYRRAHGRWVYYDPMQRTLEQHVDYRAGKSKMAAIFVSNCEGRNNRLGYVHQLQKYIPVDVYGKCGDKKCPKGKEACNEMLMKDYFFYLAFENSNCRDYITEKFRTNGLENNVIPVVLGAHPDDYRNQAPYHSYIHVQDFETPKELAEFLTYVASDKSVYNSYFEWKGSGQLLNRNFVCSFCSMVHYSAKYQPSTNLIGSYDWKPDFVINNGTSTMCLPDNQWYW